MIVKRGKVFHYAFMIDGERYRGSTKETTAAKARQFESMLIAEIRNQGGNPQLKRPPTLREFSVEFLKYIKARGASLSLDHDSVRYYLNGWRLLSSHDIAGVRMDQIGPADISVIAFPGGPWNARNAEATLSRMLNYAVEKKVLRFAPRLSRTEADGRNLRVEPWIEEKLLEHMSVDAADIFIAVLDCGMRPEEVMRIEWPNVLWSTSQIWNPYGKTRRSQRYVPLSDRLRDRLRVRQQGSTGRWVFPGKSKAGHRTTIAKQWLKARKAAEVPASVVLYCARHEFGTSYLENGGNLPALQNLFGHESIATTQKYLHASTRDAGDIINRRNRNSGLYVVKSA